MLCAGVGAGEDSRVMTKYQRQIAPGLMKRAARLSTDQVAEIAAVWFAILMWKQQGGFTGDEGEKDDCNK